MAVFADRLVGTIGGGHLELQAIAEARLRLAGSQLVVALARRSDGSFCYQSVEAVVTESACVDGS